MVDFVKLKDDNKEKKDSEKEEGKKSFWSFKKIFLFVLLFFILSSIISSITLSFSPKIAVVPIDDVIMTQASNSIISGSSLSSRDVAQTLYSLRDDNSVKAVLLDINSPGGSPVGSDEIAIAVESVSEVKPVYALISDTGASGAYWIAASADKIYASDMSIVGSIGVTSATLGFEDFIRQHNISYRRQVAGDYKDMGTPFREPTQKEEEILQNILNQIHSNFISHIAQSRNMTYEEVEMYATGEIFLGSAAKEIGLIDEIGYYPDVIKDLRNITGNENIMIMDYGPSPSIWDGFSVKANSGILSDSENKIMLK